MFGHTSPNHIRKKKIKFETYRLQVLGKLISFTDPWLRTIQNHCTSYSLCTVGPLVSIFLRHLWAICYTKDDGACKKTTFTGGGTLGGNILLKKVYPVIAAVPAHYSVTSKWMHECVQSFIHAYVLYSHVRCVHTRQVAALLTPRTEISSLYPSCK